MLIEQPACPHFMSDPTGYPFCLFPQANWLTTDYLSLKLHHGQAGDHLEVANVGCGQAVAEFQSGHTNE